MSDTSYVSYTSDMSDSRVTIRLPEGFLERIDAEAKQRRVTRTTILWEKLGLFEPGMPVVSERPERVASADFVRLTSHTPDEAHKHRFVRSSVTGLRKCACGKVER